MCVVVYTQKDTRDKQMELYFSRKNLISALLFFYSAQILAAMTPLAPPLSDHQAVTIRLSLPQTSGPTIRVRQDDRVNFIVTNQGSTPIQITPPFSKTDELGSIKPNQSLEFRFVADMMGVYLYKVTQNTYGALIVEPKEGYPTKADREYVVIQSGTAFNGAAFRHVKEPLLANTGERIRLFVLNAGPTDSSDFHVVGTVFDNIWLDGNPKNTPPDNQAVLLAPNKSAIVEFELPEAGKYVMMDHEFGDASLGAMGLINATYFKAYPPLAYSR